MLRYFVFVAFFWFHGCSDSKNQYTPARYVVVAQEIREELKQKLSEKYNMRVIGTVGGLAHRVNVLGLKFQIRGPLTMERLREILVGCVEEFLSALNSNEEIRPHLKTYPFTAKGIDIGICVMDSTGREVFNPEIGIASAYRGMIHYVTIHRGDKYEQTTIKEESYEEALCIVESKA